ncbi:PHP domain-containing protein [candidate division WOR-3 bacterium]|uniref:PHP domain-containing protein n=1 Tax=candidate division WOR-3 bacterium TaxID=2052148 RepID=A0A9D5QDK0_UNCW3|nr:PHP domain-containing protein [candidate division WOR-3 bacterium]MBD3365172.1 PHP domain-containing protein [candidate division WOR-3 bacterium]
MTSSSADLHIHTSYSDGLRSPREVIQIASDVNLKAVALTDHDTVAGLEEARLAGREMGIEVLTGVELSCELDGYEIHMLGYFAGDKERELEDKLKWYQEKREERAKEILDTLKKNNISLLYRDLLFFSTGKSIGRMHVAKALMKKGYANSIHEVFKRYLGPDGIAYVPKAKLSIPEAVELIHSHQGVAILAHPGMYRIRDAAEHCIEHLDGLEVWYPEHSPSFEDHLYAMALRNRLIPTGGSDYHGIGNNQIGCVRVPYSTVTRLLEVAVGV